MDVQKMLDFLSRLEANNEREWYHAHKAELSAAKGTFEELVQALILKIGEFDGGVLFHAPGELTFKLQRDTRFSHDKSPYNPAFRAHISAAGKLPIPVGYYVMVKPGSRSFLGGGLFADMFKDATAMIRNRISAEPDKFTEVINAPEFRSRFTVRGSALKNVPRGYDREHPLAEYLKMKSWYVEYPVSDETLLGGEDFVSEAGHVFEAMKPFNDFLNNALAEFKMPER